MAAAAAAARTAVLYFVPDDGDEEEHPNVFSIARPAGKVRLGDVKQKFPLPGGYQFRFKRAFKNTFVWADVGDNYEVVPRFEGNIVCKVSRLRAPSGGAARRAGAGADIAEAAAPVMRSASMPPSGTGALDAQPVARSPVLQPVRAQQMSTPTTSSSLFDIKPSSNNDLLGLHSPTAPQMSAQAPILAAPKLSAPPEARMAATGVSAALSAADMALGGDGDMMNLDWSSSGPSPSPSPPPQTTLGAAAAARAAGTGRSSSPVKKPPLPSAASGASSSSSIGVGKTGNNSSLSVPSDLSSAAKDFKL